MLLDPDAMSVECYRLNENNRWELYYYASNSDNQENCQVELTSIGLKFPIVLTLRRHKFPRKPKLTANS